MTSDGLQKDLLTVLKKYGYGHITEVDRVFGYSMNEIDQFINFVKQRDFEPKERRESI